MMAAISHPGMIKPRHYTSKSFSVVRPRVSCVRNVAAAAGAVKDLGSVEEYEQFISDEGPTVVDFYTTWCGPCKLMAPKVEEMANQYSNVKFAKLNLDEIEGALAFTKRVEVKSLPTFHIYKKSVKIDQMTGNNPKGLKNMIVMWGSS